MRTLRHLMIAVVTIGALVAATPAFAQINALPNTAGLTFAAVPTAPAPTFTAPVTFAPQETRNEQGLGVFFQAGVTRTSTYGANGLPTAGLNTSFAGWIFGIGFGGNKSGKFGIGADINYLIRTNANASIGNPFAPIVGALKLHYLQVPIYGRFNFMGHSTKSAPTIYALVGVYIDILLKGAINGINVKDQFNGFDIGPLFGAGFEIARLCIEYRAHWALRTLESTGGGTFLNGLQGSKAFTHVFMFKIRAN